MADSTQSIPKASVALASLRKILVATDYSDSCQCAIETAVAVAVRFRAELAVVHVIEESAYSYAFPMPPPPAAHRDRCGRPSRDVLSTLSKQRQLEVAFTLNQDTRRDAHGSRRRRGCARPDRSPLRYHAVDERMTRGVIRAQEGDGLADARKRMRSSGVRRLPVLDASGAPAEIVTFDDLVDWLAEEVGGLAQVVARERGAGAESSDRRGRLITKPD